MEKQANYGGGFKHMPEALLEDMRLQEEHANFTELTEILSRS